MLIVYHQLRIIEKTKDTYEPKKIVVGKKYMGQVDNWISNLMGSKDSATAANSTIQLY